MRKQRIICVFPDGEKGSTTAYLMPFRLCSALLAFDGRQWYLQRDKRRPFKPVDEKDVHPEDRKRMRDIVFANRDPQPASYRLFNQEALAEEIDGIPYR